jgi:ribosomal protein S12 methylthiotransferase
VDEVRFDRLGVFTYSPEEGTPSAAFADQIAPEVAAERARDRAGASGPLAWERARRSSARSPTSWWTAQRGPGVRLRGADGGQAPEIDGVVYLRDRRLIPGQFARIRIVEVEGYELVGERA